LLEGLKERENKMGFAKGEENMEIIPMPERILKQPAKSKQR